MADDDYTLYEVVRLVKTYGEQQERQLRDFREIVQQQLVGFRAELDAFVLGAVYQAEKQSLERRLTEMEDNAKWLWRSFILAIISAVGTMVVFFITRGGGA